MNEELYQQAYEEGRQAYREGKPRTAEPLYHAQLTVDLEEEELSKVTGWHHGWTDAREEAGDV